jgi:hypothetical protein
LIGVNLGGPPRWIVGGWVLAGIFGVEDLGEIDFAIRVVRQAQDIRREGLELTNGLRSVGGGEKTDLLGEKTRRESHRKAIAVRADVDDVFALGQRGGYASGVGNEMACENGLT